MRIIKYLFLTISLVACTQFARAQKKNDLEYSGFFNRYYFRGPFSISGGLFTTFYGGDLCGGLDCNEFKPGFHLGTRYHVWPYVVLGAEVNMANMGAEGTFGTMDPQTENIIFRDGSFSGTNYEFLLTGRLYFVDDVINKHMDLDNKRKRVKPFVTLGVGGTMMNPTTTYVDEFDNEIRVTEGRTFPDPALIFPGGLGVEVMISKRVQIVMDLTYRYVMSDHIDAVSVGGNNNDGYATFGLSVQYAPTAERMKPKKMSKKEAQENLKIIEKMNDAEGGDPKPKAPAGPEGDKKEEKEEDKSAEDDDSEELPDHYFDDEEESDESKEEKTEEEAPAPPQDESDESGDSWGDDGGEEDDSGDDDAGDDGWGDDDGW